MITAAEILAVLSWLGVLFLLQVSLWPYLKSSCREYAYPLSWPASVLLFTLLSWYCGLARLPLFIALAPFVILLARAAANGEYTREEFGRNRKWIALFLIAFGVMLEVRYLNSSISYAEKFMDHGFIASVMRIPQVPPLDPWFAGGFQNAYYYLGYWLLGALGVVSGVPSTIVFNLALPTIFALSAVSLYTLGHLIMDRFRWLPLIGLVMVNPSFVWGILAGKPLGTVFWDSTRTITNTINEYPLFSFTWGDVHPHVIGIFNQIFLIVVLVYAWKRWADLDLRGRGVLICLAALGLGSAPAINTWDVLIYAPLVVVFGVLIWSGTFGGNGIRSREPAPGRSAFIHTPLRALKEAVSVSAGYIKHGRPWAVAGEPWGFLFLTPVIAVLMYAPFFLLMKTQGIDGIGLVTLPTAPSEFILVHGFFLAVIILSCAREIIARPYFLIIPALVILAGYASCGIALIPFVYLAARRKAGPVQLLALVGLSILIFCELFYLKDHMGDTYFRMNTVFKFYVGAWLFLAAASFAIIGRWLGHFVPRDFPSHWGSMALAAAAVIALFAAPLVVPFSTQYRTASLDGLSYLKTEHANDLDAVTFLRTIQGNVTLVEAVGGDYTYYGRISSFTGIPAVIGWQFHEYMWRGDTDDGYGRRAADVRTIYEDPGKTIPLMEKYNATILYVGDLERESYRVNLTSLALPLIYRNEGVEIYRID